MVFSPRNFVPIYNQETVVEAFALARKSVPTAFLLMKRYGGDEAYVQGIRERMKRLGLERDSRIVDKVAYDRMPELYRAAAVTVSVPHSDAMPMSVFEAMACHSLPVASDLPSLREWIVPGVNGYLVPATDRERLARAIVDGLTDEPFRNAAVHRNRELVNAKASQAVHMRRCEALYRQTVADRVNPRAAMPE